jgi:hypothetical protein
VHGRNDQICPATAFLQFRFTHRQHARKAICVFKRQTVGHRTFSQRKNQQRIARAAPEVFLDREPRREMKMNGQRHIAGKGIGPFRRQE